MSKITDRVNATQVGSSDELWLKWQRDVLELIQRDFCGVLDRVGWEDIDWDAWRPLFDQGCSAKDAVHNAFGKVA